MGDAVVRLAPGEGLVARRDGALLFTPRPDEVLVEAFATAPPGGELQAVASATVAAGFDVAPFVGVSWDGQLRVMAFGDVAVETDLPSVPMLSGAGSRTWVEHTAAADRAVVEVNAAAAVPATNLLAGTTLAGGFRLELTPDRPVEAPVPPSREATAGTAGDPTTSIPRMEEDAVRSDAAVPTATPLAADVPGTPPPIENIAQATFELVPDPVDIDDDDPAAALAAIQAAAVGPDGLPLEQPGPLPAPSPAPEPPVEEHDPDATLPPPVSDALLADVRRTEPTAETRGSLVDAKLCGAGHANPPTAATCAVCSEFLAPGAAAVVHVPRPSLGRLQFDDGELVELDQELLVGRSPARDQDPSRAALRRVRTPGDKVSRSHLEVRFQGWDVLVNDCGSTNGTFVVPHPGGQVVALEPGRPQMIDAGAVVYFGSRSFTFLGRGGTS